MRLVHLACVAVLVTCAVGCTNTADGRALPAADAFPDVSQYPVADGDFGYENTRQYFSGSTFTSPDGQRCSTNVRDYLHRLWCYGPRPDRGGYWKTDFGPETTATTTPAEPPSGPSTFPALPAGQRIEMQEGLVCVAGADGRMFACRAGDHGFVFTETSTRLF